MPTATPLIATIVGGLTLAFIFGAIAHRLRISPLVGYLLAGVVAGPWTPGFIADLKLAGELAEIGIILLMFGVGLHFSLRDLLSVRAVAIPGAIGQIILTSSVGTGLGLLLGWPLVGAVVFGLSLSVASTVVLLRTLAERGVLESDRGRTMVGWLIVEDLVMVLALVLLPALVGGTSGGGLGWLGQKIGLGDGIGAVLLITLAKVGGFILLMLVVGRRLVPWILHWVAHTGSRELFRMAVLVLALGVAYAASASFGVSFALGAFLAGMLLSESQLANRAAQEILPLRDAFAVLFFVSVGMLFDPAVLVRSPWAVLGTVMVILCVKSLAAYGLMRLFRQKRPMAVQTAVSVAQIGEFSFILSGLGVYLRVLPEEGRDLILAGSIISILLNPLLFLALDYLQRRREQAAAELVSVTAAPVVPSQPAAEPEPVALTDHAVLVGYGHVGHMLAAQLRAQGMPLVVLEDREDLVENLRAQGIQAIQGNGAAPMLVRAANVAAARILFIAIPQAFEAGQIIQQARTANPALRIIARTYDDAETEYFTRMGADKVVNAEEAASHIMLEGEACSPVMPVDAPQPVVEEMPASLFPAPASEIRPSAA